MIRISVEGRTALNLRNAVRDLDQRMAELLQEVGVSVLSDAKRDFEVKSRRGTGADGVRWAELQESTEKKKARRGRKPRKTKSGKPRKRDAVTGAKFGQSQIGVDKGLLRNSSKPGFTGPDGKGGNILTVEGHAVTVGFGRDYATYFDAKRPLLPADLPQKWSEAVDAIVDDWITDVLRPVE